jgi:hypothetical protein
MIYLASPYSHPDPAVQEERYREALRGVHYYAKQGLVVYSPIVHWHNVAKEFDLPGDAGFWAAQNQAMLEKANQLIVLNSEGWKESKGLEQELIWAEMLGLPVSFTHAQK